MEGTIFAIHRVSTHDGPGLRTTVFLKGCPLRCVWCHNPESWSPDPEPRLRPRDCLDCRACVAACPQRLHRFDDGQHRIDRDACAGCGACATACPTGAVELVGRRASADAIVAEVLHDRELMRRSGGGITLSGGEPLIQPEFAAAILARARDAGLHTAVETSGFAAPAVVERLLPLVDLWLLDWKAAADDHQRLTGVPRAPTERTLAILAAAGASVHLRCPLVPGINDGDAHLAGIAALARDHACIKRIELMPYHRAGVGKADEVGVGDRILAGIPGANEADHARWLAALAAAGCREGLAAVSG
jgi:pyruvate formate lyase activating enzyme